MLLTSLRIAIEALGRHKLRTFLTTLGMMIGVAAVITMVALGRGAQETVANDVQSAGTNLIHVRAGNYTRGGEESNIATGLGSATTLVVSDAQAIAQVPGVKRVTANVRLRGFVVTGAAREYTQIIGTDVDHPEMHSWRLARGAFFTPADVSSAARVVVLGRTVRDRLFGDEANAVGKTVQVREQSFTVVGVSNSQDEDQADAVFIPYTALQAVLGINYLHGIDLQALQAGEATVIADQVKALLRTRHHLDGEASLAKARSGGLGGNQMPSAGGGGGNPDDFTVKTQAAEALTKGLYTSVAAFVLANMPKVDQVNLEEMTGTLNRAGATMTVLLAAIATISLLVGGIGIMNIMLVSVTERTREIGVRRAVGAKARDVLLQFLVEAVTLSLLGGFIGVVCGFITSAAVTRLLEWPTSVSPQAVALSVGISGAVGVFFGFYPARRASRLNPIDALRHE